MGIFLSILTSFFHTVQNTAIKKATISDDSDSMMITWVINLLSLLVLLPLFLIVSFYFGNAHLNATFWLALLLKLPFMVVASLCYVLAHKYGDMSLVNPILSLTPVVILILAPFTIHQSASLGGMIGVGLVVIGAYALNFNSRKTSYLEPLKLLFSDKGARYMMITATIYGLTTLMDAVGVQNAGKNAFQAGVLWSFYTTIAMAIVLVPFVIKKIPAIFKKSEHGYATLAGLSGGIMTTTQMTAMVMMQAAYVNAIKRFSMVLGVFVGVIFFHEKGAKERITASFIMLAGVLLIAFAK